MQTFCFILKVTRHDLYHPILNYMCAMAGGRYGIT